MCNKNSVKVFPSKEQKVKKNTADYYLCLMHQAQKGFSQPITKTCRECKVNSVNLVEQRNNQIQLLMSAYEQMGASLRALLTPLEND